MVPSNLKSLLNRLGGVCRRTLDGAGALAHSQTHHAAEPEHWLRRMLDEADTDLTAIFRFHEVDVEKLRKDLDREIGEFRRGAGAPPTFSRSVLELASDAWGFASIDFGHPSVRTAHVICAVVANRPIAQISSEFEKISLESLRVNLEVLIAETAEAHEQPLEVSSGAASGAVGGATSTPSLDQFTRDLTEAARNDEIDPVLGRDREIRQIVDILGRRRQNNPILTGEAGVGKTAVVEGFALRIAAGDVPPALRDVSLKTLDMGLLVAGASVKGEFERRLKEVIEEVKSSSQPIILFVDEAHTLIGAGGQAGQGDAANLLKPALARGELRTIAATTWSEYKQYFETDAALTRRFQVVKVDEPDEARAISMMRGVAGMLERHHEVRILDEAVEASVRLSNRYLAGRQLPDKSISLLDTACSRVAIAQTTIPDEVESRQRGLEEIDREVGVLERETSTGIDHQERLDELRSRRDRVESEREAFHEQWENERELVERIRETRRTLEGPGADASSQADDGETAESGGEEPGDASSNAEVDAEVEIDTDRLREELGTLEEELEELQGETPLLQDRVDSQVVADVVAHWTGIPVGRMVANTMDTVLRLEEAMGETIVGQSHALAEIAEKMRTSRARLADARKPIGVFLMVGPSGVGKTETAITLAELLYGGRQNMTVINMSEFKEEHKVSLLMGSPPGYVGYGKGGVLTEAVRRSPYSVVLLDEMEKAHVGVFDIFNQVFDKGTLRDSEGRDVDFKNTVIIMTSNASADLVQKMCADPETAPDPAGLIKALHPELLKTFRPEFIARTSLIPYYPLDRETLGAIARLQIARVEARVAENYPGAEFVCTPEAIEHIATVASDSPNGARSIHHVIEKRILPELSRSVLEKLAESETVKRLEVGVEEEDLRCRVE